MSRRRLLVHLSLWLAACGGAAAAATAVSTDAAAADDAVLQAREAWRRKDRDTLAASRARLLAGGHPLALWADYWALNARLAEAQQADLDAFYARWPGSYVEDRLRNDWLLELGRRRDWAGVRAEFPRFRMNDDREVSCYALLARQQAGFDVSAAARAAWLAQKDVDDGCAMLGRTLVEARQLKHEDAWAVARLAAENNRPRLARSAALLALPGHSGAIDLALDNPARYLARRPDTGTGAAHELTLLALTRLASTDPDAAAAQIETAGLPRSLAATAWAQVARQSALRLAPQAAEQARRAWQLWDSALPRRVQAEAGSNASTGASSPPPPAPPWSEELLAWQVRAALRLGDADASRWLLVARAIDAMPAAEAGQRDAAWVYWRARAALALAAPGAEGQALRSAAQARLRELALAGAVPANAFYARLAAEDLGLRLAAPQPPQPSPGEQAVVRSNAGLARGLALIAIGLRSEGVREWNFSLRELTERELLAAAHWACEREVWDRCINTSDRSRSEVDTAQRYPTPFREALLAAARRSGVEPAVLYGLIRQESRFVQDARSSVGASGLMQLMPETAQRTARQLGIDYRPGQITDRDTNLLVGASYLKRVLDELGGSLPLAAAGYNAGPGRPRRWREGPAVEAAAWTEAIPFAETRDYVKKVLTNSVDYAAVLAPPGTAAASLPTLKARLGPPIGSSAAAAGTGTGIGTNTSTTTTSTSTGASTGTSTSSSASLVTPPSIATPP